MAPKPIDPNSPAELAKNLQAQKEQVIATYPAFKGLVNGNAGDLAKLVAEFGQDLVSLFQDLIADGGRKTQNRKYDLTTSSGLAAWQAKRDATAYYVNTEKTAEDFDMQDTVEKDKQVTEKIADIAGTYGDLKLTQDQLKTIAIGALRKGYKTGSASLSQYIYSQVGSTPTGAENIAKGTDAAALLKIAKNYAYTPPDLSKTIRNILSGTPGDDGVVQTVESFTQAAKADAMGMYSHLRPQLEAGSTLADVFGGYKNTIARTLELDPSAIDISNPKYARLLGTPTTGQMSLADAETYLKTNDEYKYYETTKANRDGLSMAAMFGRMFGEVK